MQKLVVSFTHIVIGMTGTVFTEKSKARVRQRRHQVLVTSKDANIKRKNLSVIPI